MDGVNKAKQRKAATSRSAVFHYERFDPEKGYSNEHGWTSRNFSGTSIIFWEGRHFYVREGDYIVQIDEGGKPFVFPPEVFKILFYA